MPDSHDQPHTTEPATDTEKRHSDTDTRNGRRFVIIPQQGPRIRVRYREGSSGAGDCTLCQISPDNS